jgi:hypothetical protein
MRIVPLLPSLVCAMGTSAIACSGAIGSTGVEDKARREVPIAICRQVLNASEVNASGVPLPQAYWRAVFPGFAGIDKPLLPPMVDCVGGPVPATGDAPQPIALADLLMAPAADGAQILWLRTAAVSDRQSRGLLALAEPRPSEVDVYALGQWEGSRAHSRFEVGRIGSTTVLLGRDDGCADVKEGTECDSVLRILLVAGGRLVLGATTPAQRVRLWGMREVGRVRARMTTEAPTFDAQSVRVKEKLSVRDASDDEVRRSESERVFRLQGTELVANRDSIAPQKDGP